MSGMFPVCMLLVKGCQTLVMDPSSLLQSSLVNRVPHTIMVQWHLLGSAGKNFRIWQKFGLTFWPHTLMSGMFPVCMLLVKGCQTLVMDPSSLLQQSLVNAVPHTIMLHWYLLWSGWEFQDMTNIWPNFLTTHLWCLTCSQDGFFSCVVWFVTNESSILRNSYVGYLTKNWRPTNGDRCFRGLELCLFYRLPSSLYTMIPPALRARRLAADVVAFTWSTMAYRVP